MQDSSKGKGVPQEVKKYKSLGPLKLVDPFWALSRVQVSGAIRRDQGLLEDNTNFAILCNLSQFLCAPCSPQLRNP